MTMNNDKSKITILIDNRNGNPALASEHGFSALIKTGGHQILVDTGLSGKFSDNAAALGEDIQKVDYLILSHGHNDHIGGLKKFIEQNKTAKIIAHKLITVYDYKSTRGGKIHSLSPDRTVISNNSERFVFVDGNRQLESNISIVVTKSGNCPKPLGNRYLSISKGGVLHPYPTLDETALCINSNGRLIIISPCSHNGLLNIANECCKAMKTDNIAAFIGGLHLLDGEGDDIKSLAAQINEKHPEMRLYTSHCTGAKACAILSAELGEKFLRFETGSVIEI